MTRQPLRKDAYRDRVAQKQNAWFGEGAQNDVEEILGVHREWAGGVNA